MANSPKTGKTYRKIAGRNVILNISCLGAENGICCDHAKLRENNCWHAPFEAIADHGEAVSRNSADEVARDGQELGIG